MRLRRDAGVIPRVGWPANESRRVREAREDARIEAFGPRFALAGQSPAGPQDAALRETGLGVNAGSSGRLASVRQYYLASLFEVSLAAAGTQRDIHAGAAQDALNERFFFWR